MQKRQKGTKTGPCLVNRDGKPHLKQPEKRRPRKKRGRKCVKRINKKGMMEYMRVKTAIADNLVSKQNWQFCSKEEYKENKS